MNENKRIAKNTLFLYMRSFLMMAVNLYASRVILKVLGVEDYGLYGAIGSVVMMFTLINGSLASGTSRFLTFELGRGDEERLHKTFSASFAMHAALAFILFVLMETIGLWFLNTRMNIPEGREFAANMIYQLSILSCMFTLTQVPYSATIISHEKMDVYAYVGLSEAVFKLALVFFLSYVSFSDKLIAYGVIIALWSVGLQVFYRVYCHKRFKETHLFLCKEKGIYKSMLTYSVWDTIGAFCSSGNLQGMNILINMFFGVTLNAARTVAYQVDNALMQLCTNFTTSVTPQIVKSYAKGDYRRFFELIYESGRYSYYLLFLVMFPCLLEADYVLSLWLVEVPEYTALFLRCVMGIALLRGFSRPLINGVHATGSVKVLNLTSGLFSACLLLPIVYVLYRLGLPVWTCFIVQAFTATICTLFEIRALYQRVRFDVWDYLVKVYAKSIGTTAIAAILPLLICYVMPQGFLRLVITFVVCTLCTCLTVYFLGVSKEVRMKVKAFVMSKVNNYIGKINE